MGIRPVRKEEQRLGYAQTAPGRPCELLLATPALILTALHQSLLLLLAGPWALFCFWGTLALTCLRVFVYLLHLTLALGVMVALTVRTPWQDKMVANTDHQKRNPPGDSDLKIRAIRLRVVDQQG
ncbi:unnamed protein product [Lota lota]